jgi:hypothetical protein
VCRKASSLGGASSAPRCRRGDPNDDEDEEDEEDGGDEDDREPAVIGEPDED